MAAQRKYSPRPILGKGEDLATALHQEVQAISNALTSLGQDIKSAEKKVRDENDKALAEVIERFKAEITEINGRVISIAEWSIEMTNEIKGYARIDALVALRSRIEQQGDEILSYAQYIVALNNTVNGKADVHVILRLENLIKVLGDDILAYGGIIQEIQIEVAGKASAFALQALESTVTQLGNDLSSMSTAVTSLRNDIIAAGVPNRLANSEFQNWAPWVLEQAPGTTGYELVSTNDTMPTWALKSDTIRTGHIFKPSNPYTSINNWAQLRQGTVAVEPGQYYQASVYLSAHRVSGQIIVEFVDGANVVVPGATLYSNSITTMGAAVTGGKDLDSYYRAYVFGEAPPTAKYAKVLIRSTPSGSGHTDTYLFFVAPLFGKALTGQTVPSPYTAGTSGGSAMATRLLSSSVEQLGEDIIAVANDVTDLTTAVKNPKAGQNMLVDPVFQIPREGPWNTGGVPGWTYGVQPEGNEWRLVADSGENTISIHHPGVHASSTSDYGEIVQTNIPVVPGQRYQFTAYVGAHRCDGVGYVLFFGPTGGSPIPGGITTTTVLRDTALGGRALAGYGRIGAFVSAPSGAAYATVIIRALWARGGSVTNPYLFVVRPFMGTAAEDQTEYADWAPGAPGNMFAHLRAEGMVWADSTGEGTVGATYELKLRAQDNTGSASAGLGITAAKIAGVWRSQIDITAERFRVLDPSSGTITVPFKIYNGVTYIKAAAILAGDIVGAHIQNATITDAKIATLSASKIISGNIVVGQAISSTGYNPGVSGWSINGSGAAEFGSATIRGQLTAGQITDLSIGPSKILDNSTMIMVSTSRQNAGYIDIGYNAGAGGEDAVRKYAIFVSIMGTGGGTYQGATGSINVKLRMEWNGSEFFDKTVQMTSFVSGWDPVNSRDIYSMPKLDTTLSSLWDVTGSWQGSGWRTIRMEVTTSVFTLADVSLVVLGYKK